MSRTFARRAQALEDEFFYHVDQELIRKLDEQHQLEVDQDALAMATGICDRQVLTELLDAEITPATLMAFSLFPAVFVAWANGYVEVNERKLIVDAAHEAGVEDDSPAGKLLSDWLKRRPSEQLFTTWKDFVHAVRPTLTQAAFTEMMESSMRRAESTARSAGGFMGMCTVSGKEKEALAELRAVFEQESDGDAETT